MAYYRLWQILINFILSLDNDFSHNISGNFWKIYRFRSKLSIMFQCCASFFSKFSENIKFPYRNTENMRIYFFIIIMWYLLLVSLEWLLSTLNDARVNFSWEISSSGESLKSHQGGYGWDFSGVCLNCEWIFWAG